MIRRRQGIYIVLHLLVLIIIFGDLLQIQFMQCQRVLGEDVLEVMHELFALATRIHDAVPHQLDLGTHVRYEYLDERKW